MKPSFKKVDEIFGIFHKPGRKAISLEAMDEAIRDRIKNKYDLSDLLIAHSAKLNGCEMTLTLDKKASRFDLFTLVK